VQDNPTDRMSTDDEGIGKGKERDEDIPRPILSLAEKDLLNRSRYFECPIRWTSKDGEAISRLISPENRKVVRISHFYFKMYVCLSNFTFSDSRVGSEYVPYLRANIILYFSENMIDGERPQVRLKEHTIPIHTQSHLGSNSISSFTSNFYVKRKRSFLNNLGTVNDDGTMTQIKKDGRYMILPPGEFQAVLHLKFGYTLIEGSSRSNRRDTEIEREEKRQKVESSEGKDSSEGSMDLDEKNPPLKTPISSGLVTVLVNPRYILKKYRGKYRNSRAY